MQIRNSLFLIPLSILLCFTPSLVKAQIWNKVIPNSLSKSNPENNLLNTELVNQIKKDIAYLTSPESNGRKSGTKGEEVAGIYIEQRMNNIGLKPYNSRSFRHHFKFESDKKLSKDCIMTIGNKHIFIPEDAFPSAFSAISNETNYLMPNSQEPNAPWILPLYNSVAEAKDPSFDWEKRAYEIARKAAKRGASAVLLYDEYGAVNRPVYKQSSNYGKLDILCLIVHQHTYQKHLKDIKVITPAEINIELSVESLVGTNMIGFIDNKAAKTIVIGAHYDCLGPTIGGSVKYFQGADDNASGVGLMLAMASRLATSGIKNYNFMFVAFSAHEYGMEGSKSLLQVLDKDKLDVLYFINLDKVGRLAGNNKFFIQGTGTAAIWPEYINSINSGLGFEMKKNFTEVSENNDFSVKNIPSLLVTTGNNKDHKTVNDVVTKLNYTGMEEIGNFLLRLVMKSSSAVDKPTYTKIPMQEKDI